VPLTGQPYELDVCTDGAQCFCHSLALRDRAGLVVFGVDEQ
jgi:hypothetical protein